MERSPLGGADRYAHGAGDGYREFYYWPREVVRIAGEGME